MSNTSPILKLNTLYQVCMVVRDLDRSMAALWNKFGIGPWDIYLRDWRAEREADLIQDMTYRGKPGRFSFKLALTHNNPGSLQIELVQPLDGDSIYSDFLREKGEGIQHLGSHYIDTMEAHFETRERLAKAGFPCLMSGRTYTSMFAYIDTTQALTTIIELVWRDPTRSRPAPYDVFPSE